MAEYTTTANQGLTIPDDDDSFLKSVPDYIKALAESVEVRLVMRFATMAEFTSKITIPVNGMVFWVSATNSLYVYANGGPQRIYPSTPITTASPDAPTGTGEAGQIHYQYGD